MPKLPPEVEFDSNGPGPYVQEYRFETYAFMGVNRTKLLPDQPDWIVPFLHPDSFSNSEGGVVAWHKRHCPQQAGSVVRCNVVATEVSVLSAALPTTGPTRLAVGAKRPRGK